MNAGLIIGLFLAVFFVVVTLLVLTKSSSWHESQARIEHSKLVKLYRNPNTKMGEIGKVFDYKVELKYSFEHNGKSYSGSNIYPGLPNIFSEESLADQALSDYSKGKTVTVYFNPNDPSTSGLVTAKSVGTKGIVVILLLVVLTVGIVGGGFYIFSKF